MWGSAVMIAPVVDQVSTDSWGEDLGSDQRACVLPKRALVLAVSRAVREHDCAWMEQRSCRQQFTYARFCTRFTRISPLIPLGGFVLPRQSSNTTIVESRKNPFELLVTVGGFAWSLILRSEQRVDVFPGRLLLGRRGLGVRGHREAHLLALALPVLADLEWGPGEHDQ